MEARANFSEGVAAEYEPVSWMTLVRRQLEVVGRRRWRELTMLGGLLAALPVLVAIQIVSFAGSGAGEIESLGEIVALAYGICLLIVVLWPFSVWSGVPPSRRGYHYSLPAKRHIHDLARVVAGGVLIGATLLGAGSIGLIAFRTAGLPPQLDFSIATWTHFTGGLIMLYLLFCSICVATERPLWWLFGGWLGLVVATAVSEHFVPPLARFLEGAIGGRWGVFTPTSASVDRIIEGSGAALPTGPLLLWLGVAIALLLLAATRHREATS